PDPRIADRDLLEDERITGGVFQGKAKRREGLVELGRRQQLLAFTAVVDPAGTVVAEESLPEGHAPGLGWGVAPRPTRARASGGRLTKRGPLDVKVDERAGTTQRRRPPRGAAGAPGRAAPGARADGARPWSRPTGRPFRSAGSAAGGD